MVGAWGSGRGGGDGDNPGGQWGTGRGDVRRRRLLRRRGCAVVASGVRGGRCGDCSCGVERVRRGEVCLAAAAVAAAGMCVAGVAAVDAVVARLRVEARGGGAGSGVGRAAWAGCTGP